jgi:chromosome partitioning protein
MKSIVCAAKKGGVGKTTLTAALATAAVRDLPHVRVGIVDLDPQGSLTRWWNLREPGRLQLCDLNGMPLSAALPGLRSAGIGLLFVDCAPGFSAILRQAIAGADLVLVPTQASSLDLAAIPSTMDMAEEAGVPHRSVLNRAVFRSRLAGQAVRTLRERGDMLWPPIHQRVEIAAAMASGRTALETQPGSAAARELSAVWSGVWAILDGMPARLSVDRPRPPGLRIAAGSRT